MSNSAHWEVIPPDPKQCELGDEIKVRLARRYFDHDGSLPEKFILDDDDLPYLSGLRDAANPCSQLYRDASELIEEIESRGQIRFVIS